MINVITFHALTDNLRSRSLIYRLMGHILGSHREFKYSFPPFQDDETHTRLFGRICACMYPLHGLMEDT